jgi:hypothetical protein
LREGERLTEKGRISPTAVLSRQGFIIRPGGPLALFHFVNFSNKLKRKGTLKKEFLALMNCPLQRNFSMSIMSLSTQLQHADHSHAYP